MRSFVVMLSALLLFAPPGGARAQSAAPKAQSIAQLDAEAALARQRVIEIVNKPITHLPRNDQATVYSPGWFHPGAEKPDFNTVDVRATQQLIYSGGYVTSDLNPNEMFMGGDLEFNAMTKYFYIDKTLPKARLTEPEMLEINRLYRVIGRDEQARAAHGPTMAMLAVAFVFGLCLLYLARRFL